MSEERVEVSLAEVAAGKRKDGTIIKMSEIQAEGICIIKHKDGSQTSLKVTSDLVEADRINEQARFNDEVKLKLEQE